MALESTSPPLSAIYKDADEDYDVMDSVTSTGMTTTGLWSNATKKMKCAIGEDITQRITVVSVIMICTIVGNLALILTLTCKRSRRIKRVNVFLINLAIGDLAVALFTNTTEILFLAFGDWALGPAACKISVYMQMVTLASATFLLTAMSMDRYQVIVRPLESLAQRPRIWMKVTTAWVMAFLFATPQLFIFLQVTENHDGVDRRCCVSKGYSEEWQRKAYLTFLTSYILLIPTALMIFCYANIIHVVWIRARAEGAGQHVHQQTETEQCAGSPRMSMRRGLVTASKRRVITMTLTVVAGFVLCQTPYFIVSLIRVYSDYAIKLPALLSLSEHIVLMHSTLNPLLYGLFTLRGYHITAAIRCLSCKDVPVLQAENDHLLRGKTTASKTASKRLTSRSSKGQIYQEATGDGTSQTDLDQVSAGTANGPCTQKENHHRPAHYLSDRTSGGAKEINDHERSSPIQLMLLANHSLVKGSVETAPTAGCGQASVQAETPGVVRDRVPSVRWGETTHIVMPRHADPQPSPPALTSASWTATSWNSKNECPSCV